MLKSHLKMNKNTPENCYFCKRMKRWYLYPFSLGYHMVTGARNSMYDLGIFKSTKFKTPIINVGNLSVGGSGKSPMVMYLATFLSNITEPVYFPEATED